MQEHTLEVIARLRLTAPLLLAHLLDEPVGKSAVHERLGRLHDAGLIARADIGLQGRNGRPPVVYAIGPRGSAYLRARHQEAAPDDDPPGHLATGRRMPQPGRGETVGHELAVQLALVALRQYDPRLSWRTARMPGGRWDVGMVHHRARDRSLRLADLLPAPRYTFVGEQLDAPASVRPDVSVALRGPVDGEQAVIELLVELDRTGRGAHHAKTFAAYDQFLGGWCMRTGRFQRSGRPLVVFVARDRLATRALLQAADRVMTLGFGAPGIHEPAGFEYPGRAHTAFTCLDWLLAGHGLALRLPALPPQVRRSHALRPDPESVALLPEAWWPARDA